jgi:hypothetical protein
MIQKILEVSSLGHPPGLGAEKTLIVALGMVFASLFAVNGGLLTFRPDLFLKFYDRQNPGDYWGKSADWRKNVRNTEYKVLGVVFLLSGFLFFGLLVKALVGNAGVNP